MVYKLDYSVERYHTYARNAAIGTLTGIGVGWLIGYELQHASSALSLCSGPSCESSKVSTKNGGARGVRIGGAIGLTAALSTASKTRRDRWVSICAK